MPTSTRRYAIAKLHNARRQRTTSCRGGRLCPPVGQLRICRWVSKKTDVPTAGRTGSSAPTGACVFALVRSNLQHRTAGRGRTSPLRKFGGVCNLSQIVRFCGCIVAGRCGHRPLQTFYGFALVHPFLRVRPAGRTGSSAPTGACHSALAHSIFQRRTARAGQAPPLRYDETWQQLKTYHPSPHPALRATFPSRGRLWGAVQKQGRAHALPCFTLFYLVHVSTT